MIELHSNKSAPIEYLLKIDTYNPFSEESKFTIWATWSSSSCTKIFFKDPMLLLFRILGRRRRLLAFVGNCLIPADHTRRLTKENFDALPSRTLPFGRDRIAVHAMIRLDDQRENHQTKTCSQPLLPKTRHKPRVSDGCWVEDICRRLGQKANEDRKACSERSHSTHDKGRRLFERGNVTKNCARRMSRRATVQFFRPRTMDMSHLVRFIFLENETPCKKKFSGNPPTL